MALFELIQHTGNGTTEESGTYTFKDAALEDVNDVFFDTTEHAEVHIVDGKEVPVIFEEDRLREHSAHWEEGAKQNFDTGLYTANVVMYIKSEDYGPKPKVGKLIVLDEGTDHKRSYIIDKCTEEDGVYRFIMVRTRQ